MIKNVRLSVSSLTGNVYIVQFSKSPDKITSKKEVPEKDLMDAVVTHFLRQGHTCEMDFRIRDRKYSLTLKETQITG
jgi:hypothetical protein